MTPLLETESLQVTAGRTQILRDVQVIIQEGEFVVIVGPNGAGKTTLLESLIGLKVPSAGLVRLKGRPLFDHSAMDRARKLALLGRESSSTLSLTVAAVVELGRLPHLQGWALTAEDNALVNAALVEMDVSHLADRLLHRLSDGERQRVHWARALCQAPEVLLLDEATAHLDLRHREASFARARRFSQEGGTTIAVAHDLDLALRYASRVIVLQDGRILADAAPEIALSPRLIGEVFGVHAEVQRTNYGLSLAIYGAQP